MPYYPDQRYALEMTTIQREQTLPEDAIGSVEVRQGASVNLRDIVARGILPSRYIMVDAAGQMRLKKSEDLGDILKVSVGDLVTAKEVLAEAPKGRRRVVAPVDGIVADINNGQIILQIEPETVELEAGLDGQVIRIQQGQGVVIETYGSVVQGAWGNSRRVIGTLKTEPNSGLESLYGEDLDIQFRGAIVITRRPLRQTGLDVMEDQNLGGIIAPSIEADLIDSVLAVKGAVMLTEGFGSLRMSGLVYNMLNNFNGRQATLEAVQPNRWQTRRPEVIINPSGRGQARAIRPNLNQTLTVGTNVRMTRIPHAGDIGTVVNLPKTPILLENGLKVLCAEVESVTGEKLTVPLANLEVFGR
ncbi:MAG: hypothetical protein LCI00_13755 [Chloroflexi bacterium]|nr:hypothetical protein [Chloroflexota bacterium]MCC6892271.1 hypothetical protein [Anaerolineae bacterium]